MISMPLGRDLVWSFWDHMMREYRTKAVDKATASEMTVVAKTLGAMGILDPERFLRDYTTTIGRRIYIPFEIGSEENGWGFWNQIVVCVHEHQHVEQLDRDGVIKFSSRYVLSKAGRAAYEAEAYRCDMEMEFWRTGDILSPGKLAAKLKNYGCRQSDIAVTEKYLSMSAGTIQRFGVVNRASQKALEWLRMHAPDLHWQVDDKGLA